MFLITFRIHNISQNFFSLPTSFHLLPIQLFTLPRRLVQVLDNPWWGFMYQGRVEEPCLASSSARSFPSTLLGCVIYLSLTTLVIADSQRLPAFFDGKCTLDLRMTFKTTLLSLREFFQLELAYRYTIFRWPHPFWRLED